MNTTRLLFLLPLLGWAASVHGQGASRLTTPTGGSDSKKQLQQAADRLREAQKSGELDRAKSTAKDLIKSLPPGVTDTAKAAVQSPEARQQAIDAAKAAAGGLAPQIQGMIQGQVPAAEEAPPATTVPAAPAPAMQDQSPPAPSGPAPGALQPLAATATAPKGTPTVIIEADRSDFDLNKAIFIYSGHVRARHPDFYIECEELEVHMIQEEADKAKKGQSKNESLPTPAAPPLSKDGKKKAEKDKAPPIKKAIARGPTVVIEKRSLDGDVQQGRCKRLEYDGATGNITLSDFPQVQKGNILHSAITADTIMVFDKDGRLSTNRPSRTTILSEQPTGAPPPSN